MKVLFITSGNKTGKPGTVVQNQADSFIKNDIDLDFYLINKKGLSGYLKAGIKLRVFLEQKKYDIIHAHYTLSGWTAVLGARKVPVVLSLMGSDAYGDIIAPKKAKLISKYLPVLTFCIQPFVRTVISKSKNIEKLVWQKRKSIIIPNGINVDKFKPSNLDLRKVLNLNQKTKYILFLGARNNIRKNYTLACKAINLINCNNIELLAPYPIPNNQIPKYLNAANLLIHTSLNEGSPNLIKEAMACNCPVVSTNVGDVKWLFGNEPGHYLTSFNPDDVAKKIELALEYSNRHGRTQGRKRLLELGLDEDTIARRLISVYNELLGES